MKIKWCENCGKSNSFLRKKCTRCGAELKAKESTSKKEFIKKSMPFVIIVAIVFMFFLWIKSAPIPEPEVEPTKIVKNEKATKETKRIKEITTEITTGSIECVVDNVEHIDSLKAVSYRAWVAGDDGIYYPQNNKTMYLGKNISVNNILSNLQNGDKIRFTAKLYEDGSISFSEPISLEKIEAELSINEIKEKYKSICNSVPVETILRNPEEYWYSNVTFTGTILQIIQEENGYTEFLLDVGSEYGMVYVNYTQNEAEPRLLENDKITIYGQSYKTKKYTSLLGTPKTVPLVGAILISSN